MRPEFRNVGWDRADLCRHAERHFPDQQPVSWGLSQPKGILVTDFDGTVTEHDFYLLIVERYMTSDAMSIWDAYREGKLSHFDAMQSFFSHAPTTEPELRRLLADTNPDPNFGKAVGRLRGEAWDVTIVSAGSSWYIRRILEAAGIEAAIHSNPGVIVPGEGLVMNRATDSPFYSEDVGVDKSAVVRAALARSSTVAFAGDGPPDLAPALMVPAERRFARGFLADELQRRGEAFQRYRRWSDIVDYLFTGRGNTAEPVSIP